MRISGLGNDKTAYRTLSYGLNRPEIKDGDVLLYQGKTVFSRIICLVTRSRFSHAGIAVWWHDRLMVMEAVGKGVIVTPLSANIDHYPGHVLWYTTAKAIPDARRLAMVDYAQQELGKEYALWKSFLLGLALLFRRSIDRRDELRRENKLYCSWYVAQIYNAIGLDLKKGVSDRFMTPEDISRSEELEYQGTLKHNP